MNLVCWFFQVHIAFSCYFSRYISTIGIMSCIKRFWHLCLDLSSKNSLDFKYGTYCVCYYFSSLVYTQNQNGFHKLMKHLFIDFYHQYYGDISILLLTAYKWLIRKRFNHSKKLLLNATIKSIILVNTKVLNIASYKINIAMYVQILITGKQSMYLTEYNI